MVDIYDAVRQGKSFQLTIFRRVLQGDKRNLFEATFDGIAELCRKHFPAVAGPLLQHRDAVLRPLSQAEYEHIESSQQKINKGGADGVSEWVAGEGFMSYDHFCRSAKGPAEVRAFLYHILSLRGGWNGSGYERQFIGGQPVCSLLVPNIDLTRT